MIEEITIRFAKKEDLDGIVALCKLHAVFEKESFDSHDKAEGLNRYLFSATPSLYCLVVEKGKEIIGYASYMKQFSTWDAAYYIYMDCLFMLDGFRGFSIGEKLIDRIKTEGRKLGCTTIQWQTPYFNRRAMKFYDRVGGLGKSKKRYFLKI